MFRFVHRPPVTVADLATALGLSLSDLTASGLFGMGSITVPGRLSADYLWDMYHERPVASAADLAGRRLSSISAEVTVDQRRFWDWITATTMPPTTTTITTRKHSTNRCHGRTATMTQHRIDGRH